MALREREISDWDRFVDLLGELGVSAGYKKYVYRGQGNAKWELKPSLLRLLPHGLGRVPARMLEYAAEQKFAAHMHRYLDPWELPPQGQLSPSELWILMRQYGAPTRLLDWTWSPYVGVYFAVKECSDEDGALWYYDHQGLVNAVRKAFEQINIAEIEQRAIKTDYDPNKPRMLNLFPRMRISERLFRQQGLFSVCDNILMDHAEALTRLDSATSEGIDLTKAIIKKNAKQQFLKNLEAMNITAASLLPGMEGLAASATEIVIQNRPELAREEVEQSEEYRRESTEG